MINDKIEGLKVVREYFNTLFIWTIESSKKFGIDDRNTSDCLLELLLGYERAEFAFRSGFIRGVLVGKGLEQFIDYFINGYNRSTTNYINDNPIEDFIIYKKPIYDGLKDIDLEEDIQRSLEARNRIQSLTDMILAKFPDYLEKWEVYQKLFWGNK